MNFRISCAQIVAPISAAHGGSGLRDDPLDQVALAERPVDDHRDAALARERQDALLGLAVEDVVGHLHEIERMRAHDLLEVAMAAAFRGRDADIAQPAGRLHGEQRRAGALPRRADCAPAEDRSAARPSRRARLRSAPARARPTRSRPCRRRTRSPRRASSSRRRSPPARSRTSARSRSCVRRRRRRRASPPRRTSRATGSLPTLKVIQLPSPTSGMASPLDGMGRVRIAGAASAGAIALAASDPRTVRRVNETMREAPRRRI